MMMMMMTMCVCVCACVHACARASQRVRASVCVGEGRRGRWVPFEIIRPSKNVDMDNCGDSSEGELHERNFPGPEVIRV